MWMTNGCQHLRQIMKLYTVCSTHDKHSTRMYIYIYILYYIHVHVSLLGFLFIGNVVYMYSHTV